MNFDFALYRIAREMTAPRVDPFSVRALWELWPDDHALFLIALGSLGGRKFTRIAFEAKRG